MSVSSAAFAYHLDDPDVIEVENQVVSRATALFDRVVVFRPGHVLGQHSRMFRLLKRLASFYPLFPRRLSSCFLEGTELFVAIEEERLAERRGAGAGEPWKGLQLTSIPPAPGRSVGGKSRAYTILGANRSWRDMLQHHRTEGRGAFLATAVSTLLSWLLVGHVLTLVFTLLARRVPRMRQWNMQTLRPRSLRELLSLCHRAQHRPCQGSRIQQWCRPLWTSTPGKDHCLHGPMSSNDSREAAHAQSG